MAAKILSTTIPSSLKRAPSTLLHLTHYSIASTSAIPPSSCSCQLPPITCPQSRYYSMPSSSKPPQKSSILKNSDIPFKDIVLVDPITNSLLPPQPLSTLLEQLDQTRYSIQLVDQEKSICKIIDKKVLYDKKREKTKSKKSSVEEKATSSTSGGGAGGGGGPPKEIQLSWNVSEHDLSHKLKKAKGFLEKGQRLMIVIAKKKGGANLSDEARAKLVEDVKERLKDVGKVSKDVETKGALTMLDFVRN